MKEHFIPTIMTSFNIHTDQNAVINRWFGVLVYDVKNGKIRISDRSSECTDLDDTKVDFKNGIYRTDANFRNHLPELNHITHLVLDFNTKAVTVVTQEDINQLVQI